MFKCPRSFKLIATSLLFLSLSANALIKAQTIKVVAGGGAVPVENGGTIVATTASIAPAGIAVDSAGNVYFGDNAIIANGKNLVDELNSAGQLTGVLGNYTGTPATSLPAPANSVSLPGTAYLARGSDGNLYVASSGRSAVLEATTSGIVERIIGGPGNCTYYWSGVQPNVSYPNDCGFQSTSGIAVDPSGYIFSADSFYNNPFEYSPITGRVYYMAGGCGGAHGIPGYTPVGSCSVNIGTAIGATYYSGNLYVLDGYYGRIYKVSPATDQPPIYTTIVTVAGGGRTLPSSTPILATSADFNDPVAIASDSSGNLYVLDLFYNYLNKSYTTVLDKVTASTGEVAILAGGGTTVPTSTPMSASAAELHQANGIAVDNSGNVYISDGNVNSNPTNYSGLVEEVSY